MQAHMSACGVIVSGMVMIPPNERMTNYSVRILTVLRYVDSITMLHPSVWLGLRFHFDFFSSLYNHTSLAVIGM